MLKIDIHENQVLYSQNASQAVNSDFYNYRIIEKVRNILRNGSGEICLIFDLKEEFYTFLGGHIEKDELPIEALKRETHEEVGALINNIEAIGLCREIRAKESILQITYYYESLLWKQEERHLTFEEAERGTQAVWFPLKKCADILINQKKSLYHQKFSGYRDIEVLRNYNPKF